MSFNIWSNLHFLNTTGNGKNNNLDNKRLEKLLKELGLGNFNSESKPDLDLSYINVDSIFKENYDSSDNAATDEFIVSILNEIVNDEDITKSMGIEDGQLDEEYIKEFLELVSQYDDNGNDISYNDILFALQDIKDGKLQLDSKPDSEIPDTELPQKDISNNNSSSSGGVEQSSGSQSSGNPFSGGTGGTGDTTPPKTSEPVAKSYDDMSKAELQTELTNTQNSLNQHQNDMDSALNGTSPEVANAQKDADSAYKDYLEQVKTVDENLAKSLDDAVQNVNAKEAEIRTKESEISKQESTISSAKSAHSSAVSNKSAIDAQLGHLESINTSELESSEASHISSQIEALKKEQSNAETEVKKCEQAVKDAETKLTELQTAKATLDGELQTLNQTKDSVEANILQQAPQVQTYKTSYDNAKKNVETVRQSAVETAKTALAEDRAKITEIETAITNCENKEIKNKYSDGLLHTNVPEGEIPLTETIDSYSPDIEKIGYKDPDLLNLYEENEVADSDPFANGKNAEVKSLIDSTLEDLNVSGDISYKKLSDGTYVVAATDTLDLNHKYSDGKKYSTNMTDVPTTSYFKLNDKGELIGYQSPVGTFEYNEQGDLHLKYKGEQSYYMDLKIDTPLYLDDIVRQVTQPEKDEDIQQLMYVFYGHYPTMHDNGCQTQVAHAFDSGLGIKDANSGDVALYNRTGKQDSTDIFAGDIVYTADNNAELTANGHARHEGIYFFNIPLDNGLTLAITGDFAKNHVQTTARFIQPDVEGSGGKNGTNAIAYRYHSTKGTVIGEKFALRTLGIL